MKKIVTAALVVCASFVVMPARAADEDKYPIKVDITKSGWECNDCVYVTVTAKVDNIRIEKIDVNRGKCPQLKQGVATIQGRRMEGWWPNKEAFTPRKMQFAESLTWRFGNTLWQQGIVCKVIEARIYTNQGMFTYG
ncbi:hypothetical protein [Pantoea sp. UBA4549]|uniref:hypothetical protein n=1 Tax=Pantoea sp. UBA4549 TaxID=1947033 RepID=UPI0025FFC5C1|nr:hypothetical protein [Pantoea sp. UBA4549]